MRGHLASSVRSFDVKLQAERPHHLQDRRKLRVASGGERLVKAFAPQAGIAGNLCHPFGASDITQRRYHDSSVAILERSVKIRGHILFGFQMLGHIPGRVSTFFCSMLISYTLPASSRAV